MSNQLQKEGYFDRQAPVETPANNSETTTQETQEREQPTIKRSPSSFFKSSQDHNVRDFIDHLKQPREQIDPPPFAKQFDEDQDRQAQGESDEKMKEYLSYDDGHLKTSMWLQNNLDMGIAFLLSLRSGQDAEKYMAFKKQTTQTQQQYELGAALVKKYQAKLSLEMMFLTGAAMMYAPIAYQAERDRSKASKIQNNESKRAERVITMITDDDQRKAA